MGKAGGQGKKGSSSKRSYSRISLKVVYASTQRRKMLIMMVFKEGFSIAKAIKKLGLKLTTARFIIQKFKESGTFPMKQFKKNSRMLRDLVEGPLAPEPGPVKVEEALSLEAVKIEEKEEEEAGDAGE